MSPPGTFERVYAAIKERLRQGAYRPGDRLEPAVLSDELNASITPVRDALHRLTGERLVEAPRHEGFRTPMLTETMLRQLYAWHLDLLLLALMKRSLQPGPGVDGLTTAEPHHGLQNKLFERLVEAGGNPEHVLALKAVAERLEPIQRLESLFLDATETDTGLIADALRAGNRPALRRSLVQYHRKRQRIVPELLSELQRQ